jgi:ribosomal protein S6
MMASSIEAQIAEIEREISLRKRVYPHLVMAKKMKKEVADIHLSRMEDVLETLKSLIDENYQNTNT